MVEYTSIMKNDVRDIVPRPKWKSIVTSKWPYKIKHVTDGSIEKYKRGLWLEDSLRKREWSTRINFLQSLGMLLFELLSLLL